MSWHDCTESVLEMLEGCGPDEVVIPFGEHGLRKISRATWGHMLTDASVEAMRRAMVDAGAEHTIERKPEGGWTVKSPGAMALTGEDGNLWRWDMERSTVAASVRAKDGRVGVGIVHLSPPGRPH